MGGFVLAMSIIASYTSASASWADPGDLQARPELVCWPLIRVPGLSHARRARQRFAPSWPQTRRDLTDCARYLTATPWSSSARWPCWSSSWRHAGPVHRRGAALQAVTGYPYIVGLLFGFTVICTPPWAASGRGAPRTPSGHGHGFRLVVVLVAVVNAGGGMNGASPPQAIDPA